MQSHTFHCGYIDLNHDLELLLKTLDFNKMNFYKFKLYSAKVRDR